MAYIRKNVIWVSSIYWCLDIHDGSFVVEYAVDNAVVSLNTNNKIQNNSERNIVTGQLLTIQNNELFYENN